MGALLERSLARAPVIRKGDYDYVVHPISDGIPSLDPALLNEVTDEILAIGDFDVDYMLAAEAMAIPLATALSLRTGIPFTIVRKRRYGLQGERELLQRTGYSTSRMYINGLKRGDRITIVDDMLSTGGTIAALLRTLLDMGVVVKDVVVVIQKKHAEEAKKKMEAKFNIKVKTLITY